MLLTLGAVVLGACGSDAGSGAPSAGSENGVESAGSGDDGAPSDGDGATEEPNLGPSPIEFLAGEIRVEFSGDLDASLDMTGTASTVDGATTLTYRDDTGAGSAIFGIGAGAGSSISFTADGVASGGNIGNECTVRFTQADASGLAGTFECSDMPGFRTGGSTQVSVDAEGTFRATP